MVARNRVLNLDIGRKWKDGKYLHQIHVVQSDVVELDVLDDGGGAGVVGRVHEGEDLGGGGYPPLRLVERRQRLVSRRKLSDRDQLQEVPEISFIKFTNCGGVLSGSKNSPMCIYIKSKVYTLYIISRLI